MTRLLSLCAQALLLFAAYVAMAAVFYFVVAS